MDVQLHALRLSAPDSLTLPHIKPHGLSASHLVREGLCCRRSIGHVANPQELLPAFFPRSLSEVLALKVGAVGMLR